MESPAAQAVTPSITFSVLGPVTVALDGDRVRLGGPRQVAVLARLLVGAGNVVSMDQLIEGVWDGESPARPDVAIRSYLSNLRRSIEPGRPKGDRQSCIESCSPGYRLVVAPESVDSNQFDRAVSDGREAMAVGNHGLAVSLLRSGLDLWHGEPYEGVSDTDAIDSARSRLGELRLVATELLAEARLGQGDHETVVTDLEAALKEHPLRERLTELSMLALYRCGRQSDALLTCSRLRARLVEQLGLDPGPRIQELEAKILSQDASLLPQRPPTDSRPRSPLPSPRSAPPTTLVGRAREHAALSSLPTALRRGHGSTALITGEPGSGKSALVNELCRELTEELAIWGRCRMVATDQPLWPWGQVLDAVVGELQDFPLEGLDGLRAIAPGWPSSGQTLELRGAESFEPSHHFAPVVECLRRAASLRPIVVIIEDAHWADEASIELLAHAGNTLFDLPIGFVVTWRDTELRGPKPRHTLRQLVRMPSVVRIELSGLDRSAVDELSAGHGLTRDQVDELHLASAGNPLFVTELISGWVDRPSGRPADGGLETASDPEPSGLGPTANLRDAVLDRVERAHGRAREVLQAAALCAAPFSPAMIGDALDVDRPALEDVMDALVAAGLVVGVDGDEWGYRFTHPIAAAALDSELSGPRRSRLHTGLGRSAWRLGRPTAEIARHFDHVGSTGTSILAARFALESVGDSMLADALEEAAEIVGRGLAELKQLDNTSSLRVEFTMFLAHWARMTGNHDQWIELAGQALEAAYSLRATASDRLQAALLASGGATPGPLATGLAWLGRQPDDRENVAVIDRASELTNAGSLEQHVLATRRAALLDDRVLERPLPPPTAATLNDLLLTAAREQGRWALDRGTTEERLLAAQTLTPLLEGRPAGPDRLLLARLHLLQQLATGEATTCWDDGGSALSIEPEADVSSLLWLDATVLSATLDHYRGRLDTADQHLTSASLFCRRWGLSPVGSIDHQQQAVSHARPVLNLSDGVSCLAQWAADAEFLGSILDPEGAGIRPSTVESAGAGETPAHWCRLALLQRSAPYAGDRRLLSALLDQRRTIITSHSGLIFHGPGSYYAAHAALAVDDVELASELAEEAEHHARTVSADPLLARVLVLQADIALLTSDEGRLDAYRTEAARLGLATLQAN